MRYARQALGCGVAISDMIFMCGFRGNLPESCGLCRRMQRAQSCQIVEEEKESRGLNGDFVSCPAEVSSEGLSSVVVVVKILHPPALSQASSDEYLHLVKRFGNLIVTHYEGTNASIENWIKLWISHCLLGLSILHTTVHSSDCAPSPNVLL